MSGSCCKRSGRAIRSRPDRGVCFVADKLSVDNLARIEALGVLPGSPLNAAEGTAALDMREGEISVTNLRIAAGARSSLASRRRTPTFCQKAEDDHRRFAGAAGRR